MEYQTSFPANPPFPNAHIAVLEATYEGGVKTIEHGTMMTEETMELMKQHDVYLVPTITAGKEVTEKAKVKIIILI